MTNSDALQFIGDLKELWGKWDPSKREAEIWVDKLSPFEYHRSKQAVENWFVSSSKRGREPTFGHLRHIMARVHSEAVDSRQPFEVYRIYEEAEIDRVMKFSISRPLQITGDMEHQVEEEAETNRVKFEKLYGGTWIIHYTYRPKDTEAQKLTPENRAVIDIGILDGKDCPAKRFLMRIGAGRPPGDFLGDTVKIMLNSVKSRDAVLAESRAKAGNRLTWH